MDAYQIQFYDLLSRALAPGESIQTFLDNTMALKYNGLQLDGFSHRVIYDDVPRTPKAHAVDVSFCMGQWEELEHAKAYGKDVRTQKLAREFLEEAGYSSHYQYQCNPTEVILVEPEDR